MQRQYNQQESFPRLIDAAMNRAHITGARRVQFLNDFKKFKKRKAYKSAAVSLDVDLRKAVIMSYIEGWVQRHPEAPVVAAPADMPVMQEKNDLDAKMVCAQVPVRKATMIMVSPHRRQVGRYTTK